MNRHIDESAELYALGSLDLREQSEVEMHVAACSACAERLRDAEATIAEIAQFEETRQAPAALRVRLERSLTAGRARPTTIRPALAVLAAGLLLAILPVSSLLHRDRQLQLAALSSERAQRSMILAHFLHAQFKMRAGHTQRAKVLYARNGSWYYVIVAGAGANLQVASDGPRGRELLGILSTSGDIGTLYITETQKIHELLLLEGNRPIGNVRLTY